MIDKLVKMALRERAAVIAFAVLVLVVGVISFSGLTIEAFPDPTDTTVNVITVQPGQPAEEVERQVSIPLERAINGIAGLVRTRAISLFGLSFMTLTFKDGVEVSLARAQVMERLRLAELPAGVTPQLGSLSTPIGEIYRYTLAPATGSAPDPMRLRTLQDWVVRPKLLQVDGVADVVSYGGLVKEIHVRPDPVLLAAKGLTVADLEDALQTASQNASGGLLDRGAERLVIRSEGMFQSRGDIARVAVATRGGTPIFVSDVASVQVGWQPRQGIYTRGEDLDAVEGIVLMRRGENPSAVIQRVRQAITELEQRSLSGQAKIVPFYDRRELVSATLTTVFHNLSEGAILVVLVLFAFLLDIKAALIVASVIPLALAAAFTYLSARGMAANLLSMGAIDFGIIVDGAVVIIEHIIHRLAHDRDHGAFAEANVVERIRKATTDVARPTVFALLIIIAAYLPIFLLQRVEGRMFAPMAHTVVAALVGSLVFSLTLVPVLASFAYRKPARERISPLLRAATTLYLPSLRAALRWPKTVIAVAVAALVLSMGLLVSLGSEFLPELNEGALYLTFSLPENIGQNEARRLTPQIAEIVESFAEVDIFSSQLGRPEDGTDPALPNNLEFFVKLKPMEEWPSSTHGLGGLVAKMAAAFAQVPGLEVNFSQPIRDNVNDNISGQKGQVALKLYGQDLPALQVLAERARKAIAAVPGAEDTGLVQAGVTPHLLILPKREALGRFGMTMNDVQAFISTALGGRATATFWEGEKNFDVVLRFPDLTRQSIERIRALRVPTKSGILVPLEAIVDVRIAEGRAAIQRENGQRYIGVRMNVRGRDLGSFVHGAQAAVVAAIGNPPGIGQEWGGEFESKERAMKRLQLVVPVALLITLALLFNVFASLSLAFLILLNVPFALVGGAVGLWAAGLPFSIAAAIGFIALVGQAALNGVLVVSAIEDKKKLGDLGMEEAIIAGANERLRAVLMTAALAALGLLPAAFSKAMGAESQRPIAAVIVGGTVSAALLTLYVLPVMYAVMARFSRAREA